MIKEISSKTIFSELKIAANHIRGEYNPLKLNAKYAIVKFSDKSATAAKIGIKIRYFAFLAEHKRIIKNTNNIE